MSVRQKFGIILENKVVQKLKLENNIFFNKKWSPILIFLNAVVITFFNGYPIGKVVIDTINFNSTFVTNVVATHFF